MKKMLLIAAMFSMFSSQVLAQATAATPATPATPGVTAATPATPATPNPGAAANTARVAGGAMKASTLAIGIAAAAGLAIVAGSNSSTTHH